MSDGVDVDPAVLDSAAQGITSVIGSLEGLGITETAAVGRGFSNLSISPIEAGTSAVQKALEEFAERWAWGVRHLVQSANEIAEALQLSAGRYHIMDEEFSGSLKTLWTNVVGNPHLSGDDITDRDWGQTLADNPINEMLNSDYSVDAVEAGN